MFSKDELEIFKSNLLVESANEKDLEVLSRAEFIAWLKDKKEELKSQISSNVTLKIEEKEMRLIKARQDFLYFAKTYFPHYFTLKGQSALHLDLAKTFETIAQGKGGGRYAYAAPRANAKTTYVAQLFPLWCICFGFKHFIVEISDAVELVEGNLEAIKAELEENANLALDFPQACGISNLWKVGEFVTRNGIKLKAFGSGKRLRGVKFGALRPDLVILDDLENDTNVRSKEQRDKLEAWLDSAVMNLGDATHSMDTIYIGTILHYDSVLSRKLSLGFWNPKKFKSILKFPNRLDLWEEWTRAYLQDPKVSNAFYQKHQKAMEAGAKLLWEEALSLKTLMEIRAQNPRAFAKEQQNEPNTESQKFKPENFRFYSYLPPKFQYITMFLDPASARKKSDFSAFVVLGFFEGKYYVLEAFGSVLNTKGIAKKFLELKEKWNPHKCALEANFGGDFLKSYIKEEALKRGITLHIKAITNRENKEERIERLEIPIEEGEILFSPNQILLLEQLEQFPDGKNDDLPDALEGAFSLMKHKSKKKHRDIDYSLLKPKRSYRL